MNKKSIYYCPTCANEPKKRKENREVSKEGDFFEYLKCTSIDNIICVIINKATNQEREVPHVFASNGQARLILIL